MQHTNVSQAALRIFSGLLVALLVLGLNTSFAQKKRINRAKLEAEKKENIQKINELNQIIEKTEQKKEASVGKLNALGERITKQSKQINLLSENQELLDMEVSELNKVTGELSGNLEQLKEEYAKMIYSSAKVSNKYNQLSFLFSSNNFNQLVRRYKYLKQYSEARAKQAVLIEKVRADLMSEQVKILQKKQEQANILKEKITETQNLELLKGKQSNVVAQLNIKEKQLRQQLEDNKKAVERLENMIAKIVEREIRKSRQREQQRLQRENKIATTPKNDKQPKASVIEMSPEEQKVATSFSALRGRMPWPVKSGFISDRFGVHSHPILRGVKLNNNGVDIQTNAGNTVSVVYDGIVQTVVNIQGVNTMVAVQHGDYFTVYSKLSNVVVREGQQILAGQKIGVVATDGDGTSEINFQVWRNEVKQNPESWLKIK
ncbi:murein hydrolase activator EnvC family protein [Flectobacillus major]|uniref:murein hydrolase activator EnvC family protein n=1 Tax=Flectobacillus major TaxID=103 RepID=UPI0005C4534A|nr:peptidoglycan DD-metalloendopeptidase family protein [Flectobacillus major]